MVFRIRPIQLADTGLKRYPKYSQIEAHMSKKELLPNEIEQTPESLLDEVLNYLRFLKTKRAHERLDTAVACESALKKDWLRPEEDNAWQSL